ncbi:hypothetical protein [Dactylosporangium salmoneum]|uniref:hypothetical protein n=1 Tax=Dactylosporangium salmoneum TaxID=53361 RepID=UPI0031D29C22
MLRFLLRLGEQFRECGSRRRILALALRGVRHCGQILDGELAFRRVGLVGLGGWWLSCPSGAGRNVTGVGDLDRQLVFLGAEKAADATGADLFRRDDDSVGPVLVADLREQFFEVTTLKQQPGRHRSPPQ